MRGIGVGYGLSRVLGPRSHERSYLIRSLFCASRFFDLPIPRFLDFSAFRLLFQKLYFKLRSPPELVSLEEPNTLEAEARSSSCVLSLNDTPSATVPQLVAMGAASEK